MTGYVIVQVEVEDATRYERYKQLAQDSVAAYGGRYIVRGGTVETLEGSWRPSRLVVLEFPSVAAARRWWNSQEYEEGKALRQACASTEMVLVEGL
jgi:uncharacterized protein (DUF1330 family)